jgi:hypothetical protein
MEILQDDAHDNHCPSLFLVDNIISHPRGIHHGGGSGWGCHIPVGVVQMEKWH